METQENSTPCSSSGVASSNRPTGLAESTEASTASTRSSSKESQTHRKRLPMRSMSLGAWWIGLTGTLAMCVAPPAADGPREKAAGTTAGVSSSGRKDNLPLVRLVLALSVIWCHAYPFTNTGHDPLQSLTGFNAGWWAVNAFIAISGYCILQSRERSESGIHFLWKRFLRVYPAYFACMAVLLAGHALLPHGVQWFNLFTFGPINNINVPVWTVRIEELVYLSVAILFALGAISNTLLWSLFALGVAAYAWRVNATAPAFYDGLFRLVPYFCAGALIKRLNAPLRWDYAAIALTVLIASCPFDIALYVAPVALPYLVLTIGESKAVLPKMPDLSYGVYLWGWPVLALAQVYVRNPWGLTVAAGLLALTLGYLSHVLIEKPCQKARNRPPRLRWKPRRARVVRDSRITEAA